MCGACALKTWFSKGKCFQNRATNCIRRRLRPSWQIPFCAPQKLQCNFGCWLITAAVVAQFCMRCCAQPDARVAGSQPSLALRQTHS